MQKKLYIEGSVKTLISNEEDLDVFLKNHLNGKNGSIYFSFAPESYPMLHIMIKDQLAVAHFFKDDSSAGLISQGCLNISSDLIFMDGEEAVELPSKAAIEIAKAVEIAKQFSTGNTNFSGKNWLEL